MSGWSGVEERDVLPDYQVQHQAEGGAAEEQGAQGRAGEAAGQARCKPGMSAMFHVMFVVYKRVVSIVPYIQMSLLTTKIITDKQF